MVGVPLELGTPFYQGVSVAALIRALPGRPATMVRQRVVDQLTRFVHPLTGGTDGAGWPFDAPLTAAAVTQVIEAVEGVLAVDELQLFEYDLRNRASDRRRPRVRPAEEVRPVPGGGPQGRRPMRCRR